MIVVGLNSEGHNPSWGSHGPGFVWAATKLSIFELTLTPGGEALRARLWGGPAKASVWPGLLSYKPSLSVLAFAAVN